jgi:hypothetical protein
LQSEIVNEAQVSEDVPLKIRQKEHCVAAGVRCQSDKI